MSVELDPDLRFEDARLGRLLAWWKGEVETLGRLPGRGRFDPLAMKAFLPQVYMVDVLPGIRLRWRLIGTAVTDMAGRDSTGRFFDEIYAGAALDSIAASFREVARTARPLRSFGTFAFAGNARNHVRFEAMEVPLSAAGYTVDLVLGIGVSVPVAPAA